MDTTVNILATVMIIPVTNVQPLRASVLPDRFVSGSKSQHSAIVGSDLGSSVDLTQPHVEVIVPAAEA